MRKRNSAPGIDKSTMRKLTKNPFNSGWEIIYESLFKYQESFGHCEVPKMYVTNEGLNLGNWLDRQVREYSNGDLDIVKAKRLKEIGFKF